MAETQLQADTKITLDRIEGYIEGFWWILPNLGIALVVFALSIAAAGVARRAVHGGRPDGRREARLKITQNKGLARYLVPHPSEDHRHGASASLPRGKLA